MFRDKANRELMTDAAIGAAAVGASIAAMSWLSREPTTTEDEDRDIPEYIPLKVICSFSSFGEIILVFSENLR